MIFSGTSKNENTRPTGGTDSLTTPSGFETKYGQMRYRYVEDLVGNGVDAIDGIYHIYADDYAKCSIDYTNFNDSGTNYKTLSYKTATTSSDSEVKTLGWDPNSPFFCFPLEVISNSSYNTYFGARARISGGDSIYVGTGYGYTNLGYELYRMSTTSSTSGYSDMTSRLMKIYKE